jgi:hypothetical protein
VRGAYHVVTERGEEQRVVVIDTQEITAEPQPPPTGAGAAVEHASAELLDASPEVATLLIGLLSLDLLLRFRRARGRPKSR